VVFVGANIKRLDLAIVKAVQSLGSSGSYVQISSHGPNALDFHIAYYIGKLAAAHPGAHFRIISKDKGFDPLISHLKDQKVLCSRSASVLEVLPIKSDKRPPRQRAAEFYQKRIASSKARPGTVAKLQRTILSHFHKEVLSGEDVAKVLEALTAAGHVVINGTKVEYPDRG